MKCLRYAAPGLLLTAPAVFAHTTTLGPASGFTALLAHPFSGLDHMLVMLALALGAATLGQRSASRYAVGFVVLTAAGMAMAAFSAGSALVDAALAGSLCLAGVAIAAGGTTPSRSIIALLVPAALLQGYAHGSVLNQVTLSGTLLLSIAAAVVMAIVVGVAIGHAVRGTRYVDALRGVGLALAGGGLWLLLAA